MPPPAFIQLAASTAAGKRTAATPSLSALSTLSTPHPTSPNCAMAASIPIPGAASSNDELNDALLYEYRQDLAGISLPAARRYQSDPVSSPPASAQSSRDELSTSWPPRPSVRLVSRSARRYAHGRRNAPHSSPPASFQPWDFSQVADATDQVQSAFLDGNARAERPPREGVSGTYFIRRMESKNPVLCVFKPVDEEAGEIERSPTIVPPLSRSLGCGESPFTLGPHSLPSMSPPSNSLSPLNSPCAPLSAYPSRFQGDTEGFKAGEGAFKEVAAYLLDHDHFARVPQTALATCMFESDLPERNKSVAMSLPADYGSHIPSPAYFQKPSDQNDGNFRTKTGAFQVYVSNEGDADDFGPGVFDRDQVHSLAIFDLRTLNHDRHSGNILVKRREKPTANGARYDIIPIDHGYCLPAAVRNVPWPVWMDWRAAREPLSAESRAYVMRLDASSEARILDEELDGKIRPESLRVLNIATALLQKGVAAGLSLYDIGRLVYSSRECPHERPELEKIIKEAEEAGQARRSHLDLEEDYDECEAWSSTERMPYKSSGNLPSLAQLTVGRDGGRSVVRSDVDHHVDDFVVRYASKRISELVRRVADQKHAAAKPNSSAAGTETPFGMLSRARSIPDFGLGYRPVQAMFNSPSTGEGKAAPTPASSPLPSRTNSIRNHAAPPKIDACTTLEAPPAPKRRQPRHRRMASERTVFDKVGSLETPALDVAAAAAGAGALPPLHPFKAPSKASPVTPVDVHFWVKSAAGAGTGAK